MSDCVRDLRNRNFAWFDRAFLKLPLSWKAKLVYMALTAFADGDSQACFPSKETISRLCGIGKTAVYEGLKDLHAGNVIEIRERKSGTKNLSNEYVLLPIPVRVANDPRSCGELPPFAIRTTPIRHANANKNQCNENHIEQEEKTKTLSSNPSDCDGQSSGNSPELTEEQKHREIVRRLLFPLYQEKMEKNPKTYTLTPARLAKGLARFRECLKKCDDDSRAAYDLFAGAINALAASDFHMGRKTKQNSNTKKYNDWIDHLCKSAERFEKWLEASEEEEVED